MSPVTLDEVSLARAAKHLARHDKDLTFILKSYGPPPLWGRKPGFSTLIQIILEQQVSLASAASMFARLKKNVVPFQPARMAELGEAHLKSLGLTRQKTAYCLHLAQSLTDRHLNLSQLSRTDDMEAKTALMKIKGIGSWSADIYLLMALRRADIWPTNDLALAIAVTNLKQLKSRPNSKQLSGMAEAWRPFRSVAARMLWQYYLARRDKARKPIV
jgi:DNA-3-methyladenine glycosylase II